MANGDSISIWLDEVKQGDEEAARKIWERYFPDLVQLARGHLRSLPRQVADEEDVALSALNSFFQAAERGRFPDLTSRDSLWRLLSRMTHRKAVDLIRHTLKQKAGGGKVRAMSQLGSDQPSRQIDYVACAELTPEIALLVADQCRVLLETLDDNQLQTMALAKMEGYTNDEIAEQLHCSLRTVERRLNLIRRKWEAQLDTQ